MSPGTATFNINNDSAATVDLSLAPNNFAPGVVVTINGAPSTGDLGFRNVNAGATIGQLQENNFTVNNLTVIFDTASIDVGTLPPFSSSGNLTVKAGGNITQSAAVTTSGTASFAVLGNTSAITLINGGNKLSGSVSFNTPTGYTGNVSFTNSTGISLGSSTLGKGTFDVTANAGNIQQTGPITQTGGSGTVTFNVQGNTSAITLNNAGNNLAGAVSFNTSTTDTGNVSFTNSTGITIGSTSLGTGTLSVTATTGNIQQTGPITQQPGAGAAVFSVLGTNGSIALTNTGNNLTGAVSFNTPTTDAASVSFINDTAIMLGSSTLGKGTFSVRATAGNILENGTITQAASAGAVTFTLDTGTLLDLATQAVKNVFTGQIIVTGGSVATIDIEDFNPAATLASITLPAAPPLQNVSLTFDNPACSITFPATSNFDYNFTLTVGLDIVLPASSTLTVAGNLTLSTLGGDVELFGVVTVTGAERDDHPFGRRRVEPHHGQQQQ